ncbi:MAG: hypothetical protein SVV80_14185 [Planctomycetota bacterium]|nr:hypothetical protein [Planctomycetota bacterium]
MNGVAVNQPSALTLCARYYPEFEPFVFEADIAGQTIVIVTRVVWGGPQTAILVEELASIGVKRFLGYGIAGSIDKNLPQGSLVVADSALPTDGASKSYGAETIQQADTKLTHVAIESATEAGCDMKPVCTATVRETLVETAENLGQVQAAVRRPKGDDPDSGECVDEKIVAEVVSDKGYHSNETVRDLKASEIRSYVSEPNRGRRDWTDKEQEQVAVYANRRRIRGRRGKRLLRKRGELLERPFAHCYETGGMRASPGFYDGIFLRFLDI